MPLEPLLPLFHRLDREHFESTLAPGGIAMVEVRWSDGRMRRTAGLYRSGRYPDGRDLCEIVLSRPLLEPLPREATLSTLCHEMIHAWLDRVAAVREVHGPQFRARMATINASQTSFEVSLRHRYPHLRNLIALSTAHERPGLQGVLPAFPWRPLECQLPVGI